MVQLIELLAAFAAQCLLESKRSRQVNVPTSTVRVRLIFFASKPS